jgi:hypothetical protein
MTVLTIGGLSIPAGEERRGRESEVLTRVTATIGTVHGGRLSNLVANAAEALVSLDATFLSNCGSASDANAV